MHHETVLSTNGKITCTAVLDINLILLVGVLLHPFNEVLNLLIYFLLNLDITTLNLQEFINKRRSNMSRMELQTKTISPKIISLMKNYFPATKLNIIHLQESQIIYL